MKYSSVDLALILAVDVSSSVDQGDYQLQMNGIAAALRLPAIIDAIANGQFGVIALSLVQWSSRYHQQITLDWTMIKNADEVEKTAKMIESAPRRWVPGGTGMAVAIDFCAQQFETLAVKATRRVIDLSGDGEDNDGGNPREARNRTVSRGITINGLPIIGGSTSLQIYFQRNVIGGLGHFLIPAVDIFAFQDAMSQKLLREVTPNVA